jgi:hypothetical protein
VQDQVALRRIAAAKIKNDLYALNGPTSTTRTCIANSVCVNKEDLWHVRLAHPPIRKMHDIMKYYAYVDVNKKPMPCGVCHSSRQKKLPYNKSVHIAYVVFDLVNVDIWGPLSIPSIQGHKFFLTVVDDHNWHTWIFFLKAKSETSNLVKSFVAMIETQYKKTIKCIRSDNGP